MKYIVMGHYNNDTVAYDMGIKPVNTYEEAEKWITDEFELDPEMDYDFYTIEEIK